MVSMVYKFKTLALPLTVIDCIFLHYNKGGALEVLNKINHQLT